MLHYKSTLNYIMKNHFQNENVETMLFTLALRT